MAVPTTAERTTAVRGRILRRITWTCGRRWSRHIRRSSKSIKLNHVQRINHLGTLGTGNHFIEVCLDENENVWFLLHSGSRGVGNRFGTFFIELAKNDMRQCMINLPDKDLAYPKMATLPLRHGMHVITESLVHQNYKFLWDLLPERHPQGEYIRGKWEGQGAGKTDILSYDLTLELLQKQPTALILDEYQTWFDGLTNTKQYPWKNWAYNFVQILSEIAKSHPELLLLVVSVRNGNTDAYQQIHRVDPLRIDFKGPYARRDRQRLLLHRLFENCLQIPPSSIELLAEVHVSEELRLSQAPASEHAEIRKTFGDAWPFSPQLLQLLEDQVLVATSAQETRDLILILGNADANSDQIAVALGIGDDFFGGDVRHPRNCRKKLPLIGIWAEIRVDEDAVAGPAWCKL